MSALIRTDFEGGIRDLPSKSISWRRIGEQDASLDKTLKDWEKTSGKLDKAASKSKSGKADQLQGELNQLTQSLSSLSPMVYTTYQRLDEERLRKLKEFVISWFTAKADAAGRDGERAEAAVASLIGWETSEEVESVGRRLGGGGGPARGGTPSITNVQTTPRSTRRLSQATTGTNDFSPRPTPRQNGSYATSERGSGGGSGFAGGLKSMLGRKPTLAVPSRGRSGSSAPSTRSADRNRNDEFDTIGEDEPNVNIPTPRTAAAALPVDAEGFSVPPAERDRPPWEDPNELVPSQPGANKAQPSGQTNFGTTFSSSPSGSTDDLGAGQGQKLNLAMTSAPITESEEERQAALQKMQQTLALPLQQPSRRATTRGRRDVRNTMFGGAAEDGSLALAGAGAVGAGTLGAAALSGTSGASNSPFGASNGAPILARQSSVASVGSNNPFDSPGLTSGSVIAPMSTVPVVSSDPGLRASMTESISVIMRSNAIQRVQINGEIHLSLRGQAPASAGPLHIRLLSFEALEKIAPNPAYLAQVPDKPGEYFLNTEVLASATQKAGAKGTLLFKYQVHVPAGQETAAVPLLLEPIFNAKDGETRMILHYRPNAASSIVSASALTELSIVAAFAPGVSVSNVQAKPPGGVWSPATRRMTWQLPAYGGEEGKIIAKFTSEAGEALSPQGVMATFTVDGALGSGLGIELVDGPQAGLRFEEVKKGLITGKYLAEAVMSA